jgi:hypothetical protein
MEETNQDSLALYLRINHQQLRSLLLATGLASLHGRLQQFRTQMDHSDWDTFCVKHSLGGYFGAMSVNSKRHYFLEDFIEQAHQFGMKEENQQQT